ncbi:hypothetical protein KIN20_024312 [Parelaphostrongylus tenuis]|uniref:Uncharacterized protein n=1 Tax=Parelaphostrongylus tenuis TaxID=148309 RepID=A0AAD5N9W8_PARTN|nr:hypothetical protein KIN20_024312 [Parelaphostrongylus tenuis]
MSIMLLDAAQAVVSSCSLMERSRHHSDFATWTHEWNIAGFFRYTLNKGKCRHFSRGEKPSAPKFFSQRHSTLSLLRLSAKGARSGV